MKSGSSNLQTSGFMENEQATDLEVIALAIDDHSFLFVPFLCTEGQPGP